MSSLRSLLLSTSLLAAGHGVAQTPTTALATISADDLVRHIKVLASDEFEGRAPGSSGETRTVAYLTAEFKKLGLKPGNPNGTWVQAVPLRGMTPTPTFSYTIAGQTVALRFPDQFVAHSTSQPDQVAVDNADIVFVGYGVQAPEYGWDDYKGVDVRGKTLLMLINDPAVADPRDPAALDPALFKGKAMTYYGRWTYKYEIAAKLGAKAAIIIHETKPAAYPWDVVRSGGNAEQFSLVQAKGGDDPDAPPVPGWIQLDQANAMLAAAGYDFDTLKQQAITRDFRPVELKGTASLKVDNQSRTIDSHNVVALIEGSDPKLKHELVVYSAHWDHLGIDGRLPGERSQQIYHGALDNASGTAALLALAKAYQALPTPPKRSILFLATTAEERGLLGAKYYASHPLYPLKNTVANINIDGINAWGKTAHIENVTSGHSSIDGLLAKYAQAQGRKMANDSRPELGSFYRADQLEFARVGVPVLYTKARSGYLNKPDGYAAKVVDHYFGKDYHQVTDDVRSDWDFSGGAQDIGLLFQVGLDIAQGAAPSWNAGSEFKAAGDHRLK
jgi:Zn-dependent M28 family amino/carboxypeptidase